MSSYCTACLQNIEPEIRYDGPAQYLCCPNCREQIFAEIKTDTVQASLETINYDPLIIETFVRAPNPPKLLANSVPEVIPFLKIVHTASVDIIPSVSIPIPRYSIIFEIFVMRPCS
ncbi:hypothetical protein BLNAU_16148 [Blattamonas nauphoetae]|uniref:Uncharacterized protein n=1 Tax=Blattamonas nauphoetae TaxID=2049346 RepID=A0ABQ9XCG6_9EUKA|nr:hypothetical protein BLNAU_16148 [Blattamonas nauphoetae]